MLIPLPRDTLIIHAGEFGQRVVDLLDTSQAHLLEATGPVFPATVPYASRIVSVRAARRTTSGDCAASRARSAESPA